MKHIESEFFLKRKETEINEINPVVDLFSTLEEVKTAKRRLYNPRHRTPESQKVWNKLPDFLEKNKELLNFFMGSKEVAVHLHGSMLLGFGTDGKKRESGNTSLWETPPSDIDLLLFTGEKDENEEKYQAKYGQRDKEFYGEKDKPRTYFSEELY